MTQRETIQLLMKALGETIPEHGCRHANAAEYCACNRCMALREGNLALATPEPSACDFTFMPCCVIGCPENATFVSITVDSIFYYCDDHGQKRGLTRGIPLDDKSKTYDDYSKSRNRVLGNKS